MAAMLRSQRDHADMISCLWLDTGLTRRHSRCVPRFQVFFCEGVRVASQGRPKRSAPPVSRFQDVVFEPPPAA
eukprot:1196103-Prymnesium_polylepis.1